MKKTIGIIVCIMLGLGGIVWFLVAREEMKRIIYEKEKEIRAKKMQEHYDEIKELVNGSKPKINKVRMVKA